MYSAEAGFCRAVDYGYAGIVSETITTGSYANPTFFDLLLGQRQCSAGHYCAGGKEKEKPCAPNTYQPVTARTACRLAWLHQH
jgi:hypothetical protein